MKILAVGDVYGTAGIDCIETHLRAVRSAYGADMIVVNGENCAPGNGMDVRGGQAIFDAGADVITGGNHSLRQLSCFSFLDDQPCVLRPLNFPDAAPGKGYCLYTGLFGYRILVINVQGQIYMNSTVDNPFNATERVLTKLKGQYDFALCDFHGEATSEKAAFAACFDGRIAAIWGTHTHVQTADERVLPGGSGFITDLGMCGVEDSIIGTRAEQVVKAYKTHVRTRYEAAEGKTVFCGCLFDVDPVSGKCLSVQRIRIS